jgi:hypothetical protein
MTKIKWEGWHQFVSAVDFLKFCKANIDISHNTILWVTPDTPIVIWLN